jgi:hypothetical protein
MKKISDAVRSALDAMEIRYHYDQENEVVDYKITTDNTSYRQRLVPLEDDELLVAITNFPIMVPEDKRYIFANIINKINYTLLLGYFVMDAEDGELTFRVSCPLDDGAINETIVKVVISNSIHTIEQYFQEFLAALSALPATNLGATSDTNFAYA